MSVNFRILEREPYFPSLKDLALTKITDVNINIPCECTEYINKAKQKKFVSVSFLSDGEMSLLYVNPDEKEYRNVCYDVTGLDKISLVIENPYKVTLSFSVDDLKNTLLVLFWYFNIFIKHGEKFYPLSLFDARVTSTGVSLEL